MGHSIGSISGTLRLLQGLGNTGKGEKKNTNVGRRWYNNAGKQEEPDQRAKIRKKIRERGNWFVDSSK